MQVGILGPLEVRDSGGARIEVTGARLRALLVRLALDAGRPVPAPALVDAVWDDRPPADEANALQTLVSRLRRTLGDPALVTQSAAGYRLAVEPEQVDALQFEALAADGAQALRRDDPATASRVLREGLLLWRGPALADAADSLRDAAARLTDRQVAAVVDRVTADIALGQADVALPELEALSAQFPLDERVAGQLITALAGSGRQAEALRVYERVRERLADELGVDPCAELQAVHLSVLRGEIEDPVEPQRRTNLKAQLTSFVGRGEEVLRVGKALAENRLVTIVGPGGAGKTRLASEAGGGLSAADGVWLAELAPVTDPADIAPTVLGALGLREKQVLERHRARGAQQDATTRLLDSLADKDAVIVLDNCEHLIDGSARLAGALLEQCPRLRVLATSREPLGIIGEVVLAVPPLGQPDTGADVTTALEYPAVRLFADRAAAARPDFAVDDVTVATVIDIVRRLDGLPLAIELAAARLRTLPVTEIAGRLSDRFRLLTGGSRTALPRHRTLRAVVEWSWELLTEPERRLAERLAILSAGIVTESATAVCADGVVPADDVPDLLASLIDKSLLQRVGDGHRSRMLETIREYGVERLAERGELLAARRRHGDYFADLLDRAEPHLTTANQLPWFALLTEERENIVAALRFRCDIGDADGALVIAVGLCSFGMLLGNHADIPNWTSEALAVPGGTDDSARLMATALYALHAAAAGTAPHEVNEGMRLMREVADDIDKIRTEGHPLTAVLRIAVGFFSNDLELTNRLLTEQLQSPDPWVRAAAKMFRANLAENEGAPFGMRQDVEDALREFRAIGERWGLANTLRSKALLDSLDGRLADAEASYVEALDLMAQLNSGDDEAFLQVRIADLAYRQGDLERARATMRRAYEIAERNGDGMEAIFTISMLADFERRDGNVARARELHGAAMRRVVTIAPNHPMQSHGRSIVFALATRFAFDDGDTAAAQQHAVEAFTSAVATRDRPILAAVAVVFAEIAAEAGREEAAAQMLGAAASLRGADDATAVDIALLRNRLCASLGQGAFEELYAYGKGLDRDAAMKRVDPAEALADL